MNYQMDASALCAPFGNLHTFRHGWGRCVCGQMAWPGDADAVALRVAAEAQPLVGQRLLSIEVVPLGVMFHFENGVYWAYARTPRLREDA